MSHENEPESCESITVTVRSNSGVDSTFEVESTEDAAVLARQYARPEYHMICVEIDGERTDRWDRERIKNENHWVRTNPDEMEVLGRITEVLRG